MSNGYEPGRIGRALREGGASIGQALRQLGGMRYRAARDADIYAAKVRAKEESRRRWEAQEERLRKREERLQGQSDQRTMGTLLKAYAGAESPQMLASIDPVATGLPADQRSRMGYREAGPEIAVEPPNIPGFETEAPAPAPGAPAYSPLAGPRMAREEELKAAANARDRFKLRGLDFPYTPEGRREAAGLEAEIAAARRAASGSDEPPTIRVAGRTFPDTPRGRTEALIWKRESREAGRPVEDEGSGGYPWDDADGAVAGGASGGGRFRAGTVNPYTDPNFGSVGTDIPGRENAPDAASPAPASTLLGPRAREAVRLAPRAIANGADPDEVFDMLVAEGVPESQAREIVGGG